MAVALLLALLVITLLTLYLFLAHPWWFPSAAALHASVLDHQFNTALWFLGGLFVAGHLVLAFFLLRARSQRLADYSHGSRRLEITWTLLIAVLFFWFNLRGERVWSAIKIHQPRPDSDLVQVEVTGAQFQWYFRYPGPDGVWGRTDAQKFAKPNEGNPLGIDPADPAGKDDIVSTTLILPVNRSVDLTLRAQDVIHSVFIPSMRFKQDAVPGMDIHAQVEPLELGEFEMACSQLCGLGHYRMRAIVRVVSEEEFKKWLMVHRPRIAAEEQRSFGANKDDTRQAATK